MNGARNVDTRSSAEDTDAGSQTNSRSWRWQRCCSRAFCRMTSCTPRFGPSRGGSMRSFALGLVVLLAAVLQRRKQRRRQRACSHPGRLMTRGGSTGESPDAGAAAVVPPGPLRRVVVSTGRADCCPAGPCRGDRTQRRISASRKDSQVRELRHAAAVCGRSGAWPVALRRLRTPARSARSSGRRWNRRTLRRQYRHRRVESLRRRPAATRRDARCASCTGC